VKMAKEEEEIAAIPVQPPTKKMRITKNSTIDDLPAARLQPGNHFPLYNSQRKTCVWCNLKAKNSGDDALKTHISCKSCNAYLCINDRRNCFQDFHTLDS
jgi:hypothetical protein